MLTRATSLWAQRCGAALHAQQFRTARAALRAWQVAVAVAQAQRHERALEAAADAFRWAWSASGFQGALRGGLLSSGAPRPPRQHNAQGPAAVETRRSPPRRQRRLLLGGLRAFALLLHACRERHRLLLLCADALARWRGATAASDHRAALAAAAGWRRRRVLARALAAWQAAAASASEL